MEKLPSITFTFWRGHVIGMWSRLWKIRCDWSNRNVCIMKLNQSQRSLQACLRNPVTSAGGFPKKRRSYINVFVVITNTDNVVQRKHWSMVGVCIIRWRHVDRDVPSTCRQRKNPLIWRKKEQYTWRKSQNVPKNLTHCT